MSRAPLFQTMFTVQGESDRVKFGELQVEEYNLDLPTSKFDLVMIVAEDGEGATVKLNYATDLFEAATMRRAPADVSGQWRASRSGVTTG